MQIYKQFTEFPNLGYSYFTICPGCIVKCATTAAWMKRAGLRSFDCIYRDKPPADPLAKPLKQACYMTRCYAAFYATRKMGNSIHLFLKDRLRLPINREKSGIRKPANFTILGYGFVPTYVKGENGKYQLVVSDKSWKSLTQKLKTITKKTTPAAHMNVQNSMRSDDTAAGSAHGMCSRLWDSSRSLLEAESMPLAVRSSNQ
jgi:hypothetical protein